MELDNLKQVNDFKSLTKDLAKFCNLNFEQKEKVNRFLETKKYEVYEVDNLKKGTSLQRLTLPFFLIYYYILLILLPFNFFLSGKFKYSSKSVLITIYKDWKSKLES